MATLLGLADDLRKIFSRCPEASRLDLKATDFGWNAGRGRCQTCLGLGEIEDGSGWVACPHCGGRRFGEEVLSVRLDGHSVADILELSIEELLAHSLTDEVSWRPLLDQLVACGFRGKPITDSGRNRSLIPIQTDHRFRSKPITFSRG